MDSIEKYKSNDCIVDKIKDGEEKTVPKIDTKTDYEKGIFYKAIDGTEWPTMKEVEVVNKAFWDAMMIQKDDSIEEVEHKHCR